MIIRRAEELSVDEVLSRRGMLVAVAGGELTAPALLADWLFVSGGARLPAEPDPLLIGALVWRIGSKALRLYALRAADDLVACGVADALVPPGADLVEWARGWVAGRSGLALDAAASLIRRRGGDVLERAEFARLFAAGEPQQGLAAFLAKRKTIWLEPTSS